MDQFRLPPQTYAPVSGYSPNGFPQIQPMYNTMTPPMMGAPMPMGYPSQPQMMGVPMSMGYPSQPQMQQSPGYGNTPSLNIPFSTNIHYN